jgi:flavin-dependent dehydrogenase
MGKLDADVIIIGAGPAGSVAAGNLRKLGHSVLMLEKEKFPRFSIGESLLPQSMGLLEEAGMLRAVMEEGFQYKNGAAFVRGDKYTEFDFRDKHSEGWGIAFQVQRGRFDQILAGEAQKAGAELRFGHEITSVDVSGGHPRLGVRDAEGKAYEVSGRFLLDASGFARVLPRMLKLHKPSAFPMRQAIFSHVADHIPAGARFDRNKILVTVHPKHVDVWYWSIPFSNGRCSVGVVAEESFLKAYSGDLSEGLKAVYAEDPGLKALYKDAVWDTPARTLKGYASDVSAMWGPNFALLGNAGEFLDPVFSSGVTIAFKSASLASPLVDRQLKGGAVDWEKEFAVPLKDGVDAFRAFVESWYQGGFQNIIFYEKQDAKTRGKICAILAGYAWDKSNHYVAEPWRLKTLEEICAPA